MGNEVLYCAGCQTRLLASEFEKQKAFKIDAQAWCAPCAKQRFPDRKHETARREKPPPAPADASKFSSSTRVSIHKTPRRGTPAAGPRLGLVLSGVAGVVLVVILLFAASGGSKPLPPRPPPPEEAVTTASPAPAKEPPSFVRPPPPPEVNDARRQALRAIETELGVLDGEIAAEIRAQSFGAALRRLHAARGRHAEAEWTLAVDRRLQDVASQARQALQPLLKEAAAQRANAAAVESIRKKVSAWELPSLVEELDAAVAAASPPAPTTPASPPNDAPWQEALAPAVVRDYAAAAAALEAAAKEVSEPRLKKACILDAELLRKVDALHREAMQAVARLPKGQAIEVTVFDLPKRREVKGAVERVDGFTIELAGGEHVEAGELSTPSLLEIRRLVLKSDVDPLTAAVYSLLDSQTAPAKALAGEVKVPDRFWRFSEYKFAPDPEAREAFEKADALGRDPATAVEAAAAFRALLAEHGTTAFVRRNRATIERRAALPKEFFFGPDRIRAGRAAARARLAKVGTAWVSGPGPDGALDLGFTAEPGTTWKAWAYVGGCCAEALAFSWQIVDATEPAAVRPQIFTSHRTHAQHGGVKDATRWGWVPLTLPAFPTGGAKTLRLLPSSDGFTLAHAVVSSVRASAPTDAEVKALRVDPPEPPTDPETAKVLADPSLIGWWRFDEGTGTAARDLTRHRNDGRILGASWVQGVSGAALSFDGQDDAVVVPYSKSLDACARQFTFAAWVQRLGDQDGWRVIAMRQRGNAHADMWIVGFGEGRKVYYHANGADRDTWTYGPELPLKAWTHVAATRDDTAVRLYVNGKEVAVTQKPVEQVPEAKALTFGAGQNEADDRLAEQWHGILDEARLYSRALSPAEIRVLAGGK
ncbi:MAG TPA: LamG domain-containing protein [Planctomycetota bacterium]|nr:LamG domain-containing protein [Planctomycetota bacterium]